MTVFIYNQGTVMPKNKFRGLILSTSLVIASAWVESDVMATETKTAIAQVFEQGSFQGELTDGVADLFKKTTHSQSPVIAKIKIVQRYKQSGCGRLEFEVSQTNVPTKSGAMVPFASSFQMSLCADGGFATEGVDLARIPPQATPEMKDVK